MGKGLKIFLSIIYYLVCLIFGIVLSIILPLTLSSSTLMKGISSDLAQKKYDSAIAVVGGFFNDEEVLLEEWENGGIVLFEATTLYYEEKDDKQITKLQKTYAGYIFGLKDKCEINGNNSKARIGLIDSKDKEVTKEILDYDQDKDEVKDSNSFIELFDFFYLDFPEKEIEDIKKIIVYDANGNVFKEFNCDLSYSTDFFSDVSPFLEEYNIDINSSKLEALNEEFLDKSAHYKMSSYGEHQKTINRNVSLIIIVYAVVVVFIGDSLIGSKVILRTIKKIFKHKKKEEKQENL